MPKRGPIGKQPKNKQRVKCLPEKSEVTRFANLRECQQAVELLRLKKSQAKKPDPAPRPVNIDPVTETPPPKADAPLSPIRRHLAGGDWGILYLDSLAGHGQKKRAAEEAGVTLRIVVARRRQERLFEELETQVMEVCRDMAESEIMRRAVEGWEEPVFGSGGAGVGSVQVGTIRRFDSGLLLRLAERVDSSWRSKQIIETSGEMVFLTRADRLAALAGAKADMRDDAIEAESHVVEPDPGAPPIEPGQVKVIYAKDEFL